MTDQHEDERFAARLREWAADYQTPPATPRDEMWQAIARQRASHREVRRPAWMAWGIPAAIAATLVVGIALGRMTVPDGAPTDAPVASAPDLAAGDPPVENVAFEVATRDHMQRVETFLKVFRTEAQAGRLDGSFGVTARSLAARNRMLMASPAGTDPTVQRLLGDVELVLLQIQEYDVTGSNEDLEFIDDGIEQRGVLLKLRALTTQGAT